MATSNRKEKVQQVIDLIIGEFSEEELKTLSLPMSDGEIYTFREILSDMFNEFRVRHNDLETTKRLIKEIVTEYKKCPWSKAQYNMQIEFEVKLFKPTLLFRLRMWEYRCLREKPKSIYELSYR